MSFDIIDISIAVLVCAAVTLLIYAVFGVRLQPEAPVNRRIAMALGIDRRETIFDIPGLRQVLLLALLVAKRFPFARARIRRDLEASGNPNGYSVEEYLALCVAGAVLMLAVGFMLAPVSGMLALFMSLLLPLLGFYVPLMSLTTQAEARTRNIARTLPYTLDLIGLMMEAGATFTEAIKTLIHDDPNDDLNQELKLVQGEIEFGTTRAVALRNMAERVPLESLRGVVGAINQSEALGTPLSAIMKNQALMLRNLRSVAAEEAAAKASLRILVPSMLILLAVVLVIFSPLLLALLKNKGGLLG